MSQLYSRSVGGRSAALAYANAGASGAKAFAIAARALSNKFALIRPAGSLARKQPILGSSVAHAIPHVETCSGPWALIRLGMSNKPLYHTILEKSIALGSIVFAAKFALDVTFDVLPLLPIALTVELTALPEAELKFG